MKATGVLRRIDDLGRIVIPKEIRKNLKIREGESLEIFVENNNVVLTKHSDVNNINMIAQLCADTINDIIDTNIIITDNDKIIAASGSLKRKYLDQSISEDIVKIIFKRETYSNNIALKITPDYEEKANFFGVPIISNSDVVGLVMAFSSERVLNEIDEKITQLVAKFLSKQIEE